MVSVQRCNESDGYNFCRRCEFGFRKGFVKNVKIASVYGDDLNTFYFCKPVKARDFQNHLFKL
jgi:hypothetical protein